MSNRPGIFVGSWEGHGRGLVVRRDGSATVTYRVYTFCSDNPNPPCDQMNGNVITSGGHVALHIVQVVTANHRSVATALVLTSTDPRVRRGSTERLVLDGDVITSTSFGTFCDAKAAQTGACGA